MINERFRHKESFENQPPDLNPHKKQQQRPQKHDPSQIYSYKFYFILYVFLMEYFQNLWNCKI